MSHSLGKPFLKLILFLHVSLNVPVYPDFSVLALMFNSFSVIVESSRVESVESSFNCKLVEDTLIVVMLEWPEQSCEGGVELSRVVMVEWSGVELVEWRCESSCDGRVKLR